MRTASIALLLSLSLSASCSAGDGGEVTGANIQDDAPAAAPTAAAAGEAAQAPTPSAPAPIAEPAPPEGTDSPDSGAPATPGADADADAASPMSPDSGVLVAVPLLLVGRIVATLSGDSWCNYYVDGTFKGGMSTLDLVVPIGDHEIRCEGANGRTATALVSISVNETETITMELPPVPASAGPGTLVAVAVGGSCTFSVNGAPKGTSSQLKLTVPPGTYSVSCKPAEGAQKTRSVIIKPGETAMAMFKLQ